jgi:hypothetical protein
VPSIKVALTPGAAWRFNAKIQCEGGHTQIHKVLSHAKRETQTLQVAALVFVGDAMEENFDELCHLAGELGRLNAPCFMFQEGDDRIAERAFREIARLTRGAYAVFDPGAAHQLRELLRAVAAFAAGGLSALSARKDAEAVKLLGQVKG